MGITLKTRPLGDKGYSWGMLVGWLTGLYSLVLLASIAGSDGRTLAPLTLTVLAVSAILCCIGLVRRRKLGAVMFFITYVGSIQFVPVDSGAIFLIFTITTGVYLKKRWVLLAPQSSECHSSQGQSEFPPKVEPVEDSK